MDRYVIRRGRKEDCSEILRLIQELADHEGKGKHVNITKETLMQDGFGVNPFFRTMVVELANTNDTHNDENSKSCILVGLTLFFYGYDSWKGRMSFLEDFFVNPDHRGKGLGAALFHRTSQIAHQDGCNSMMFYVFHGNNIAKQFYEKLMADNLTKTEKWDLMELSCDVFPQYATEPLKLRDCVSLEDDRTSA